MDWQVKTLERVILRRAARRYAAHGWDVMPGAAFTGVRHRCDDPGCPTFGCHPALERWAEAASRDISVVSAWWRSKSYTVLLPTGRAFDVLEVPAHLGALVARGTVRAPVAVTGARRWMILVRPGQPLRPELDGQLDVVLHGRDSWIPAPPSKELAGRSRWEVSPEEVQWRLPDSYAVQLLLVDALEAVVSGRPWARSSFVPVRRLIADAHRAA